MASQARRHGVTLLAPSGREQPVVLLVSREGVRLQTVEGKEINTFAYETIRKWLPSHLRSKNPGPDDCLDLQIETDKGPRDLRMRCSSSSSVKQLMKDLRDTVESIMRDMDDQMIQEQDEAAHMQQQSQARGLPGMQEMPTLAGPMPSLQREDLSASPAAARHDSPSQSNAGTQTLVDLAPHQRSQGSDSGAPHSPPLLVQGPPGAGGVAQLFVAHPTGIALPVGARGVPTPALMEGLHHATGGGAAAPLTPASGAFAYEYLDNYGVGPGGLETGELEVTDRAPSTAPAFFNAMFMQQRAGLPGYGMPPPTMSSPMPPPIGVSGGGAYYPQPQPPQQVHYEYMQVPPPQPMTAYFVPVAAAPPPPPPQPHPQFQSEQAPAQFQQAPRGGYEQGPRGGYEQAPQGGTGQRRWPSPGAGDSSRPQHRRSDPAATSPARRRVEFSGVNSGRGGHGEDGSDVEDFIDEGDDRRGRGRSYGSRHAPHYQDHADGDGGAGGSGSGSERAHGHGHVRSGGAPPDGGTGTGAAPDLHLQVRFLEDLVSRLSTEVSRRAVSPERATAAALALMGAADGPVSPTRAAPPPAPQPPAPLPPPAIDYEALLSADALGAAAVLRDQKMLAPLLAAYDGRISALEADLRARTETVQALKAQVDDVVEENDRLRSDLGSMADARDTALAQASSASAAVAQANSAAAAAAAAVASTASQSEELELLRRENELLVAQQTGLDGEIQRLHRQLQERQQDAMRAGQEQAALVAQAQQALHKAQEADARSVKLTEGLRTVEAKAAALAAQAARSKAVAEENGTAAVTTKASLDELRHAHAQLQAEAAAAHQRYKVASDGAASLQLELSTQRERNDALAGQVSALHRECETLRNALGGVEGKLTELQRRDADVWSRVKEAMSSAEEARLARDTALARCSDLERQVELANTRLTTARQATRDAVVDEFSAQVSAAQTAASHVRDELSAAHTAVTEWRARAERLERDQASLTSELATLREDTSATLASKSRLGLASLGAVEKVAALERERDDAVAKLESAQRKAERAARDWQLERQSYEHTLRGLKSSISELEAGLSTARAESSTAKRQGDVVARELAAARASRQQAEAELRQQIASLRADREAEVRALAGKIDAQAAAATVAASEAERLLSNKQEVLARWREEAQTLASRMEAALSDHKRELSSKAHEAAELRGRCEALAAENVDLAGAISELEAKVDDLHGQLADADARADAAASQVVGAANREAELQQELRQVQMMLDRTHFEKSRMQRANDPLTAKYDALKKDIRQATLPMHSPAAHPGLHTPGLAPPQPQQPYGGGMGMGMVGGVGTGWGGSPDAVVHAARIPRGGR